MDDYTFEKDEVSNDEKLWNMDSIAVTTLIFGLFLQINVCPLMCQI